jgi:hypothetical protein
MIMSKGVPNFAEALRYGAEVLHKRGLSPAVGDEISKNFRLTIGFAFVIFVWGAQAASFLMPVRLGLSAASRNTLFTEIVGKLPTIAGLRSPEGLFRNICWTERAHHAS